MVVPLANQLRFSFATLYHVAIEKFAIVNFAIVRCKNEGLLGPFLRTMEIRWAIANLNKISLIMRWR